MTDMLMRIPAFSLVATAAVFLTWGCASNPPAAGASESVKVYAANPYVGKTYEVVGPLWTGSWRTAFRLPTYPTREEAIAALQAEAARLNADALVSVSCLDEGHSTWFKNDEPGFLCYGVAIRVGANQG